MIILASPVGAADLSQFTNKEAISALKTTLLKGADSAIATLGQTNGFLGNPGVKIPLPAFLSDNKRVFKMFGMGSQLDSLEQSINRAAEAAVPQTKNILKKTITNLSVDDARQLLAGSDTAVTDFLRNKTSGDLQAALLPLIKKETVKLRLSNQYNKLADKASQYGFVDKSQANLETYVTNETMDGLFLMIGKEEKAIRENPVKAGSELLKKIFSKD